MPRLIRSALAATLVAASTPALASTWEIDPMHTSAQFAVKHLVISTVRGTLGKVSGVVILDDSDLTASSVQATIDATGIDTGEAKRDEHLRSADFLDVGKYPTVTFRSKKVEKAGDEKYTVTGDLTIRGVTKEVVLDVAGSPNPRRDPFGNTKLGGVAKTLINRKDFGVSWSQSLDGGGLVVGDDVDVTVDVELIKQQ